MRGRATVVIVGLAAIGLHQWWTTHPFRLSAMPRNSIWVPGPSSYFDLEPSGDWLGCWPDEGRNTNRCRAADYLGNTTFEGDFVPLGGGGPVGEDRLQLHESANTSEQWIWGQREEHTVPFVRLKDGTTLVPAHGPARR